MEQIQNCLSSLRKAIQLIRSENLLEGFMEHKWILIFSLVVAGLFSFVVLDNFFFGKSERQSISYTYDSNDGSSISDSNDNDEIKDDVVEDEGMSNEYEDEDEDESDSTENKDNNHKENIKKAGKNVFFEGGMKYLLLIFLEVLIFYFAGKTLWILSGKKSDPQFKDFVNAEIRMIKIMLISFIKVIIFQVLISIVFSIIGLSKMTTLAMFFVHAYFIGYAFFDNYNEQYALSIKKSEKRIAEHKYAATSLGVILSLILHIPLIGPIIAPFLGAVTATVYGYDYQMQSQKVQESN